MEQLTVAIAGASGYIGGRLIPQLLDQGHRVRCFVRSPLKLAGRRWADDPRVEIRSVEHDSVDSVRSGLQGCNAAFYLIHSMTSSGQESYSSNDRKLALSFARAARDASLGRIIYLGGLGETGPGLSQHLSSRREVETLLASTGVPVTVLRAAMIVGSGSASFEILRYLVERLPVMVTPKWVSTLCEPIAVRNVIGYLTGTLTCPETIGQVFDIGGGEVLPYREIMRIMAEELGLGKRLVIPVPVLTPRLSSYWIHLVTPLGSSIAKPLAEGLKNPVVCRENRIAKLIPQDLLDVRSAIRAALTQIARHNVETNWAMAGVMPGDPDWAGGTLFRDARSLQIAAPAASVFRAVCRVGGGHGWYAADWLWQIRGWMDRLVGGPGLRRGRRDPEATQYGEALDFWRVVGYERDSRLSLRAEMKLPGEAMLEFRIDPSGPNSCVLHQIALFQPKGLFGLLYWWSVVPLHHIVFSGMLRGIARESLKGSTSQAPARTPTARL